MEKAKQVCIEMLTQRGYNIIETNDTTMVAEHETTLEKLVTIIGSSIVKKLNIEQVGKCMKIAQNFDIKHIIIIYEDVITPVAKTMIKDSIEIIIEIFKVSELQVNITKHRLVPLHRCLSCEEAVELKECFNIENLPIIFRTDPISRFYNYKKNSIIEILRKDGTLAYRVVKDS